MRLLAPLKQGYSNAWLTIFLEFGDLVGQTPEPMHPPPSAAANSRMQVTLGWMHCLKPSTQRSCGYGPAGRGGKKSAGTSVWRALRRTRTVSTRSAPSRGG